ncbi:Lipase/lipooxygenase, PLAT/LH2 [Cynara cardunculus var. scolymus]|uniref:Lipase/lipooxygenase, PLAT/LH2 n=1 Tax=Cynara cardunculus var. scolymus TaxID=59895 RepID=A0A103XMQ6_CYNCS|nr:Lipase/lipooxygenase, PLAT/LH2 [Cynara cardunculus var. scolymus]
MGVKNMMACVKNSNKNCGGEEAEKKKINGTVVLMKKNFLDLNDFGSSILDRLYEIFGKRVSIQLISSTHRDPCNGSKGKIGKAARLEDWVTKRTAMAAGEVSFSVTFDWEESMGAPGGLMVKNHHHSQFYLKTVTLEHAYLPCSTPEPLQHYREQELVNLRGTGSGKLKEWDRVYDYAFYNDLGLPDKGPKYARPVLGGSQEYPYPRRGRTGRGPTKTDPKSEKRLFLLSLNIYVPRDERFNHIKFSDFLGYAAKSIGQVVRPELKAIFDRTPNEFDSFKDVLDLYGDGVKLPKQSVSKIKNRIPLELVKELLRSDGEKPLTFPMPDVIKDDKSAWREDEEFGREMLAGVNPVVIRRLQVEYTEQFGLLFILDHHDALMPYLTRINSTASKIYATRTILLLQDDGTLKPLAIELSLPKSEKDNHGCISDVFTPSAEGVCGTIWQLAKAYVALSVMHPINKLLQPHFRDTMNINALARQILINAGGILEMTRNTPWNCPPLFIRTGSSPSRRYPLIYSRDYPFAVDGLEIWSAIQMWCTEYCSIYYLSDDMVKADAELQKWWTELRTEGHGDKKDEPWWPQMQTRSELIHTCTIIIWVASALHAAVNFGQYPYAGYLPNRPTVSRRFMPKRDSAEYAELESDPERGFLKTITSQLQTLLGVSLIEILSRHSTDEIYLGQSESPYWTSDNSALEAFKRFGTKLVEIEKSIATRNDDKGLKNRLGPVKVSYTLLYPNTSDYTREGGLTGKGIPNSISI